MIFRFHCLPPRLGCRSGIPLLLILFGGPDRVCAQAQFFFDDAPPLGSPATLVGTGGSFEFAADDGRYTISMSATGSLAVRSTGSYRESRQTRFVGGRVGCTAGVKSMQKRTDARRGAHGQPLRQPAI